MKIHESIHKKMFDAVYLTDKYLYPKHLFRFVSIKNVFYYFKHVFTTKFVFMKFLKKIDIAYISSLLLLH